MPLRARRRRIRALWALGALLFCGALFYGVSWISYLPQFNVSSISISGAKDINEELIKRSIETVLDDGSYHILSRRNIFLYPRTSLEKTIANSFPLIKSVHIARPSMLATDIVVTIEEREPFARWCPPRLAGSSGEAGAEDDARCYFMDDSGFIYAPVGENTSTTTLQANPTERYIFRGDIASSTDSTGSPQVSPVGQWFVQAHLPGLLSLLKFLGQAGFTALTAEVENDQDILVRLQEGFLLKASFGADAGTLVKNLQLVLASDVLQGKHESLEYIDLRFGNRVYYKLFSGGESAFGGKGQEQQSAE